MYIPFDQLPPRSRLWIYQASRPLTDEEVERIKPVLVDFITQWTSHGSKLQASAEILYNRFLVIANNEDVNSPSGCSIDASVHFVKQLETMLHVSFFDRTQLAFLHNDTIQTVPLPEIKNKIKEGLIQADSLYFDTLLNTSGQLQSAWPKPAKESWLAKYFV
ncbi:hypothetical protein HUW51_07600 [Adhaeribacter swui]|uniref:ABC transporter ATPase n=1 Tax=Adhaeribacter swui TaxID=2086471 RepID=A0A7G7G613_9BACT|nr:hypothetical protein [Adhaeribacter swui]QNF32597.1 hypothetical protein HUW51_07600 [Adhaeribacter swui]